MDATSITVLIVLIIIFLSITIYLVGFIRHFLINSLVGIVVLLLFNLLKPITTIELPITIITVIITGLLGLAGIALLIILKIFGIAF